MSKDIINVIGVFCTNVSDVSEVTMSLPEALVFWRDRSIKSLSVTKEHPNRF